MTTDPTADYRFDQECLRAAAHALRERFDITFESAVQFAMLAVATYSNGRTGANTTPTMKTELTDRELDLIREGLKMLSSDCGSTSPERAEIWDLITKVTTPIPASDAR